MERVLGWVDVGSVFGRFIIAGRLELYALIGIVVIYIRNRDKWPQRPARPSWESNKPKQETSGPVERPPAEPISRTTYVLRQISLWLVMALVFLLIFRYFAPSGK